MRLNHFETSYGRGAVFSPCLRAFFEDLAFPAAVLGPVAHFMLGSVP